MRKISGRHCIANNINAVLFLLTDDFSAGVSYKVFRIERFI